MGSSNRIASVADIVRSTLFQKEDGIQSSWFLP